MHTHNQEFQVEAILDKKRIGAHLFYLVKWKDCPEAAASWQPIVNLGNCESLIRVFESRPNSNQAAEEKKRVLEQFTQKVFEQKKEVKKELRAKDNPQFKKRDNPQMKNREHLQEKRGKVEVRLGDNMQTKKRNNPAIKQRDYDQMMQYGYDEEQRSYDEAKQRRHTKVKRRQNLQRKAERRQLDSQSQHEQTIRERSQQNIRQRSRQNMRQRSRQKKGKIAQNKMAKPQGAMVDPFVDLRASKASNKPLNHDSQPTTSQPNTSVEVSQEALEKWMNIFSGHIAEQPKPLEGAKSNVSESKKAKVIQNKRPILTLNFRKKGENRQEKSQQTNKPLQTSKVNQTNKGQSMMIQQPLQNPHKNGVDPQKSVKLEQSRVDLKGSKLSKSNVSKKSCEIMPQLCSQQLMVIKQMIRINKQQSISILAAKSNLQASIQGLVGKKQPAFKIDYYQEINKAMTCLALTRQKEIKPYIDKYMLELQRQTQLDGNNQSQAKNQSDYEEK